MRRIGILLLLFVVTHGALTPAAGWPFRRRWRYVELQPPRSHPLFYREVPNCYIGDEFYFSHDGRTRRLVKASSHVCGLVILSLAAVGAAAGGAYLSQYLPPLPVAPVVPPPPDQIVNVPGPVNYYTRSADPAKLSYPELVYYLHLSPTQFDFERVESLVLGNPASPPLMRYCQALHGAFDPFHDLTRVRNASSYLAGEPGPRGNGVAKAVVLDRLMMNRGVNTTLVLFRPRAVLAQKLRAQMSEEDARSFPAVYDRHACVVAPDGAVADPSINFYGTKEVYFRDYVEQVYE
jgi:hypothetical protein